MSGRGFLISFEGGEGAGKSTQIRRLAAWLSSQGRDVLVTREPGGSPAAEQIRDVLLHAATRIDGLTQTLLFAAARRDHVLTTIRPGLERGAVVLCDRFIDSTRAYQGAAGDVLAHDVATLEQLATDGLMPDLTILLDTPPETGLARAAMRRNSTGTSPDRFESEAIAFHRAVRESFLRICRQEPQRCVVIDASMPAEEVFNAVKSIAERRLAGRIS